MSNFLGLSELIEKITEITRDPKLVKLLTIGEDVYIELVADGAKDTPIESGVTDLKLLDKYPDNYHESRVFIWPTGNDGGDGYAPVLEGVGKPPIGGNDDTK